MGFVQTITIETSDIGPVQGLSANWHATQAGIAPGYVSSRVLAERDQAGKYLILVEFTSAEAAAENNERPETAAWAQALSEMISGPAVFVQYDEVERSV